MEDEYDDDDFEEERPSGESSRGQSLHHITPIHHRTVRKTKKITPPGKQQQKKKVSKLKTDLSPQSRLLSSKDHEIRKLRNQLLDAQRSLKETRKENTIMRRTQVRMEKELMSRSRQEEDIPNILQKHSDEVRALRTQLQRTQINNNELKKRVKDIGTEMWKSQERVKKLDAMVKKRNLPEREQLVFQLQELQEQLKTEEDKTIKLDHSLQLAQKTYSQEIKNLLGKNHRLTAHMEEMREENRETRRKLREKERLLEVTNIYSQRVPGQSQNNSLSLPPIPVTDEMTVLHTKPVLTTSECQTDSSWLNDLLSLSKTSPNKEPVATETKRGIAMATIDAQGGDSLKKFVAATPPLAAASLQATPPAVAGSQATAVPTKPLATLAELSKNASPASNKSETVSQYKVDHSQQKPVKPVDQVSQSDEVRKLLFGSNASSTDQTRRDEAPPTSVFGGQKKDDLLQKLFPNQTIASRAGLPNQSNLIPTDNQTTAPTTSNRHNESTAGIGSLNNEPIATTNNTTGLQPEAIPNLSLLETRNTTTTNTGITSLTGINTSSNSKQTGSVFNTGQTELAKRQQESSNTGVTSLLNKSIPPPPSHQQTVATIDDLSTDNDETSSDDDDENIVTTKITARGHPHTYPPPTSTTDTSNLFSNQTPSVKTTPGAAKNEELMKKLFPKQSRTSVESVTKITSSTSSNVSWNDKIENMHQGLPSMASEEDRFNHRRSNPKISSNHSNGSNAGNGDIIDVGKRKPKHGRRAGETDTPIFGRGAEREDVPPRGTSNVFGGGGAGNGYPWEIPVNTRGAEQGRRVTGHSTNDTEDIEEVVI
ncbi:PREDICTED: uncharacterized protein LOC100636337 [Amphimedon queenslandica]|uniref:Lebercilin domain-containing protein n=1 Tax=Amphimedon queenslandica TaxID=400682 RepID=A0AAN0IPL1_AMPQE|nr:PREDICTED: uncharacterized protein LOC100636337 [Amphimedon queenslandica]|eukprot:XP_011405878.2 PREDICTED: uncharacterized protein LOC100636337 [Amphimedon queenslandica]